MRHGARARFVPRRSVAFSTYASSLADASARRHARASSVVRTLQRRAAAGMLATTRRLQLRVHLLRCVRARRAARRLPEALRQRLRSAADPAAARPARRQRPRTITRRADASATGRSTSSGTRRSPPRSPASRRRTASAFGTRRLRLDVRRAEVRSSLRISSPYAFSLAEPSSVTRVSRLRITTLRFVFAALFALAGAARADGIVGRFLSGRFPRDRRRIARHAVIGFGAAGAVARTPVIFLHGNNDTPFPTACDPFGKMQALAQYLADHGYATERAVGPRLPGRPVRPGRRPDAALAHRAHRRRPTCPTCAASSHAVLATPARSEVDIVGHSLGVVARARVDAPGRRPPPRAAPGRDRRAQPRHHQLLAVAAELLPGCRRLAASRREARSASELGSPDTPFLRAPEPGRDTPRPDARARDPQRRHELRLLPDCRTAFSRRFPADRFVRQCRPTSRRARGCKGADELDLTGQGAFDPILGTDAPRHPELAADLAGDVRVPQLAFAPTHPLSSAFSVPRDAPGTRRARRRARAPTLPRSARRACGAPRRCRSAAPSSSCSRAGSSRSPRTRGRLRAPSARRA